MVYPTLAELVERIGGANPVTASRVPNGQVLPHDTRRAGLTMNLGDQPHAVDLQFVAREGFLTDQPELFRIVLREQIIDLIASTREPECSRGRFHRLLGEVMPSQLTVNPVDS